MGDVLHFWNMRPDATLDSSTLHGGCPVIRGNKWPSTKWICMSLIIKLKKKERMSLLQVPHSSYNVQCSSVLVLQPQHKTSKKGGCFMRLLHEKNFTLVSPHGCHFEFCKLSLDHIES
ncbi:probable prolyl 4-hydroxylase 7 [Musa acuminata AAA Group]|uniref:probable prolyl 4-hydroxylase 7 n=1 Tax=Musa acuminata AAA Group TaxID=214697 RepID=UPI0031E14CFE